MKQPVERRLAAILAADVAGYSRLMGVDEEGTLERLKAHRRELVDPKIRGSVAASSKTTGDGMLVEFPSVVDAVRCAVEVQRAMIARNAEVPEDERIIFRIGVNPRRRDHRSRRHLRRRGQHRRGWRPWPNQAASASRVPSPTRPIEHSPRRCWTSA